MCTRNQAFEILKTVYRACDPILERSIHDAILYGSYARGDFHAESDIDILLTFRRSRSPHTGGRFPQCRVRSVWNMTLRFPSMLCRSRSSNGTRISCRSIRMC